MRYIDSLSLLMGPKNKGPYILISNDIGNRLGVVHSLVMVGYLCTYRQASLIQEKILHFYKDSPSRTSDLKGEIGKLF